MGKPPLSTHSNLIDTFQLFAILFFFMLFVLGVGSLIALKGCAFTVILDAFPHLKTWHVSFCTAVVGFLVGLVYITPVSSFLLSKEVSAI